MPSFTVSIESRFRFSSSPRRRVVGLFVVSPRARARQQNGLVKERKGKKERRTRFIIDPSSILLASSLIVGVRLSSILAKRFFLWQPRSKEFHRKDEFSFPSAYLSVRISHQRSQNIGSPTIVARLRDIRFKIRKTRSGSGGCSRTQPYSSLLLLKYH